MVSIKNGLTADGIAGTKTLRAMGIYSNTGTGSSSTNSMMLTYLQGWYMEKQEENHMRDKWLLQQ